MANACCLVFSGIKFMSMPPVFVINLDKSTDRMVKVSKRLSELGIAFERISAVYGADLSQEEIDKYYCPELNKKKLSSTPRAWRDRLLYQSYQGLEGYY